jgi:hypothetical protein
MNQLKLEDYIKRHLHGWIIVGNYITVSYLRK